MPHGRTPTHFLCIPLGGAQLGRSLAAFRADVTGRPAGVGGISREAVRPLGTLHLTLGVMALGEDGGDDGGGGGVRRAVDVLRSLRARPDLLGPASSLTVTLQGLRAMQSAARTTVLYAAPVDPEGVLHRFCAGVRAAFGEAGLLLDEGRPLLLHATVVNTVYAGGRPGGRRARMTMDARDLISRYDGFVWLDRMPLDRLALCRMGAKRVEGGGEDDVRYEVEADITL